VANEGVRARYGWLLLLGLAIGWFEAAVVVYLRALYYPEGFRFPVRIVWDAVVRVEIVREAASLLLLAAAARLAGRGFLERFAAFMVLFGVWDLLYYVFLKLLLGWPASLADWDILFLIPLPWLGPVWAPCLIAATLLGVGSYLYWTADRPRSPRAADWIACAAGGLLVIVSFLWEWRAVVEARVPQDFPIPLFLAGWLLALGWFWRAERRATSAAGL
jgi:hypothetical protein